MAPEYSVRINRRDGIVEIDAPDKDWITEQLDKLAVVYAEPPGGSTAAAPPPLTGNGGNSNPPNGDGGGTKPRKAAKASTGRASRKPELEEALTSEVRTKLQSWIDERPKGWKSKTGQAAIIATFLMDHVGWEGWIDQDDLYTVYSVMGITDGPSNYRSQMTNAKQRNGFFGTWNGGRLQLTHGGEKFGRHDAKGS